MEITKEFLQNQIASMTQELGNSLDLASQIRGAINTCKMLVEHLKTPESEDEIPTPVVEGNVDE